MRVGPSTRPLLFTAVIVAGLGVTRPLWSPRPDVGQLVEVVGEVPNPGMYRVQAGTVAEAVAAAGGADFAIPAPIGDQVIPAGYRVDVGDDRIDVVIPPDPLLVGLPVDVNQAEASSLQAIPGIGEATARAIVTERERGGPFYAVEQLTRVRGIGPATVDRIAPFLTVGEVGPQPEPQPLDLNLATAAQLETLPGIGPVTAARIVVYRDEHGPFETVDALQRVHGIGPATVQRLGDRVAVSP